jgi:hypothetical protein
MLGSSVDEKILQHMIDSQAEFLMEVTDKTKADIKVRTWFNTFTDLSFSSRVVLSLTTRDQFAFLRSLKFHQSTLRTSSLVSSQAYVHTSTLM